jgi:hypothetical protein
MDPTLIALAQVGILLLGAMALVSALLLACLLQELPALRRTMQALLQRPQPAMGTNQATAVVGADRLAADATAVAALGWPTQLRRLSDGTICLWLPLGQRDGLPVDAFFLLPREYPLRPPQVVVACGAQRLPLELPRLASWTAGTRLVDVVKDALGQTPGLQPRRGLRLNAAGELA